MDEKLQGFHQSLLANPNIKGIPNDFNQFKTVFDDSTKSELFYQSLKANPYVKGLPDNYSDFVNGLAVKIGGLGETQQQDSTQAQPQTQAQATPQQERRPGFLEGLNKKIASSTYGAGEMITEIPQFIESIPNLYWQGVTKAMINRMARKGEISPEKAEEMKANIKEYAPKWGIFEGLTSPGEKTIAEYAADSDVNKWLEKTAKQLSKEGERYDKEASEYLRNGQIGKAIGAISYGVAESLAPTLLAAFGGRGGAAVLGLMTGAQTYDNVKDRDDMKEAMKVIDGVSTGVFEALFEYLGTAQMTKILSDAYSRVAKDKVEDVLKSAAFDLISKAYKKFGVWFASVHEGLFEGLTTLAQNATAIFTGEDPDRKITDGVMDTMLVGMGMGTMFSGVEQGMEQMAKRYQRKPGPSITTDQGTVNTSTGPLQVPRTQEEVEATINEYGQAIKYGDTPLEQDPNPIVSFAQTTTGQKVILKQEAGISGDRFFVAIDLETKKPVLVKASDIKERKDVPYQEWFNNEKNNYVITKQQADKITAQSIAPVKEGQDIILKGKPFIVTNVDQNGITLNEIDEQGNITGATLNITPDKYGTVFGGEQNAPVENMEAIPSGQANAALPETEANQGNVQTEASQTQFPVNKNGEIDYDQIQDPNIYAQALQHEFGEDAITVLDETIAEKQKALEKAKKAPTAIERHRMMNAVNTEIARLNQIKQILIPQPNDTQDQQRLPSEVGIGQEPVQAEPNKETGNKEAPASGVLQTQEEIKQPIGEQPTAQAPSAPDEKQRQKQAADLTKANTEVNTKPTEAQKEAGNYTENTAKPIPRNLYNFRKGDLVQNIETGKVYEIVETPKVKDPNVRIREKGRREIESFKGNKIQWIPVQREIKAKGVKRGPIKYKPDSDYGKALSKTPDNFEEAVMQFFIGGGRVSTEDFIRYMGFQPFGKEGYLWAVKGKANGTGEQGVRFDVMHEHVTNSFGIEDQGATDEINEVARILNKYHTRNDMVSEILHRMNQEVENEMTPEDIIDQMEDASEENVKNIVPEIVDNLIAQILDSKETMSIFTSNRYFDENGDIDWNKLKDIAENDPGHFKDFPFTLNETEFENLKILLNDPERQREISQRIRGDYQTDSRTEEHIVRTGPPANEETSGGDTKETDEPTQPRETGLERARQIVREIRSLEKPGPYLRDLTLPPWVFSFFNSLRKSNKPRDTWSVYGKGFVPHNAYKIRNFFFYVDDAMNGEPGRSPGQSAGILGGMGFDLNLVEKAEYEKIWFKNGVFMCLSTGDFKSNSDHFYSGTFVSLQGVIEKQLRDLVDNGVITEQQAYEIEGEEVEKEEESPQEEHEPEHKDAKGNVVKVGDYVMYGHDPREAGWGNAIDMIKDNAAQVTGFKNLSGVWYPILKHREGKYKKGYEPISSPVKNYVVIPDFEDITKFRETLKTSNHTVQSYANGLISLDQAKEKINYALASLTLGRGFNQSFEDYLRQNPDVKMRRDELEAIKAFLATNPTPEQAKEALTRSDKKPDFAGEIFENPKEETEAREYRYKMLARPFDIGTYPKEGFIKSENDPEGGYQILTYSRRLSPEEQNKWDFLPLTEIEEIRGKEFTDKDGYFDRIVLDWSGNKKFAKVSMYDKSGDLVDETPAMKASEIIKNINDGEWIVKNEARKSEFAGEAIEKKPSPITTEPFVYTKERYPFLTKEDIEKLNDFRANPEKYTREDIQPIYDKMDAERKADGMKFDKPTTGASDKIVTSVKQWVDSYFENGYYLKGRYLYNPEGLPVLIFNKRHEIFYQYAKVIQALKDNGEFETKIKKQEDVSEKQIEEQFRQELFNNYDRYKAEYISKFGYTIGGDNAKELSPVYRSNRTKYSEAVHEPASEFAKKLFEDIVSGPLPEGLDNSVVFTAGGTGAGKTTAIKLFLPENNVIVYDSNMSNLDTSKHRIDFALKNGKDVEIVYIWRDPYEAFFDGVVPRMRREGRSVSVNNHVKTHVKALATFRKIYDLYKDNENVRFRIYNTEYDQTLTPEQLLRRSIDPEKLTKKIEDEVRRQRKLKWLTTEEERSILRQSEVQSQAQREDSPTPQGNGGETPQSSQGTEPIPGRIAIPGSDTEGTLTKPVTKYFGEENIDYPNTPISLQKVVLKDGRTFYLVNYAEWEKGGVPAIYEEEKTKQEEKQPKKPTSSDYKTPKGQAELLKYLIDAEDNYADNKKDIDKLKSTEVLSPAKRNELKQRELIQEQNQKRLDDLQSQVDDNILSKEKQTEIRKIIKQTNALNAVIATKIINLQNERNAKEKSLQKRNEVFGDRKAEEDKKKGMQDMFASDYLFTPSSDLLKAALKPFNDGIKKAEEEIHRNNQILDEKIDLILNKAQGKIDWSESPSDPADTTPIDKESLPKLEDFGEKIGGARKDMGITRTARDTDSLPAWRRKYFYANVSGVMNLGDPTIDTSKPFLVKWSKEVKSWSGTRTVDYPVTTIDTREPKIFNSEEEAEAYIPIYEVWKQGFRIRKKEGNYVVTKTSSTGKIIEYATFPTEEEATTYMYSTEGATSLLNHKREDFSIPALDKVERTGKDWRKGKDVSTDEFMETFGFRGGEFGNWVKPEERRVMLNAAYDSFMDLAEMLNVPPRAMSLSGELSIAFGARGTKGAAAHFEPDRAVINLTRMNGAGSLAHEWAHALDNYFGLQAAKKDYTRNEEGELKSGRVMRTTADLLSKRGMRKELSDLFDAIVDATQEKSVTRVMGIDEKQKAYDGQIKRVKDEAEALIKKFENGVRRYKYDRKAKKHGEVIVKATPEQIKRAQAIIDKIIDGKGTRPKWAHIPGSKGHLEYSYISPETMALEEVYKEVFGRSGLKRDGNGFYNLGYFADKAYAAKEMLDKALAGESETLTIPTEFLKTSKKFDRSRANPYWSTKIEMFARAFEYFIETKLEENKLRSDYLQYDKSPVYDALYGKSPYPKGEERTELNRLFQEFFNEVKTKIDENNVTLLYETPEQYLRESLDGYESHAKRQKAVNQAIKNAEKLNIHNRLRGAEVYPKIQPRTVLEGFKESGYVDFIGQKINTPQDIADLWSIHRSPYIEKAHAIFVRDNVIVGTTAFTLNRVGVTAFPPPEVIKELYDKYGADGVYYLHNHPSGNHEVSRTDVLVTYRNADFLADQEAKLLGHLVIDSDKFSFIDPLKYPMPDRFRSQSEFDTFVLETVKKFEYKNAVSRLFSEREKLPASNTQERMFEISKALLSAGDYPGAIIYLSSNLSITAYDVFPYGSTAQQVLDISREGLKQNLGRSLIFIHDGSYNFHGLNIPEGTLDIINTKHERSELYSAIPENLNYENEDLKQLWEKQPEYDRVRNLREERFAGDLFNVVNEPETPLGRAAVKYNYKKSVRTGEETIQGIREYIQDLNLPVRKFEEEILRRGGKQDNNSKPYRDMSLAYGRQEKLYQDYFDQKMKPILQSIANIKKAGIPGEEILPYIICKHAIERNAFLRGKELNEWIDSNIDATPSEIDQMREQLKDKDYSGVMPFDTDADGNPLGNYQNPDDLARDIVNEFESKVDKNLIDDLWNNIRTASTAILDTWEAGNQISPDQKQEYIDQYRYFVPLRGWREGAAKDLIYTKGEGFSKSLQHAEGRKSLADNPLSYLLSVEFQAIAEQVDNEVKTSMLNLILKNLNNNEIHELATIKKLYYVKVQFPDGSYEWEPTTQRPAPDMFDKGDAKTKIYREHERLRKPRQAREHEVIVRKPGGDMVIVFKGKHLKAGQALNKQNYMYRTVFGKVRDARNTGDMVALMGDINNMLKAAYTSWNVVFPFTNFMRDFQEATITTAIKGQSGAKVIKGYAGAFPAIARRMAGKPDMSNRIDRDLDDFYRLGGATGYTHSKTIEEIEKDIDKAIKRMVREGTLSGSLSNYGHTVISGLEAWNRIFEDATRFSVYMASLAAGNTKEDAAYDAKEASVNFNRKGKDSKKWDAWFAFFNVAVQSLQKNFKLAKDHPGKFSAVALSFITIGFLEALMNTLTDDPDDPDSSYYNINPYMRQNYLLIPNIPAIISGKPKSNKYLSIPLPQFWRGFKSMGAIGFDIATNKMTVKDGIADAICNFAGGLLPIDVGGFFSSGEFSFAPIFPTVIKPIIEVAENKNYMGYSIKNEPFTREQKKYLANAGLGKENVNPAAKFLTDLLFRWGGGEGKYKYYYDQQTHEKKKVPFFLDINPSSVEHLFKGYTGGTGGVLSDIVTTTKQAIDPHQEIDFRNVPFVNRFIRKTPPAKWNIIAEYYNLRDEANIGSILEKEAIKTGKLTGNYSNAEAMYNNKYLQEYNGIFDLYERELKSAAKEKEYDIIEGSKRAIDLMEHCIKDIHALKRKYGKK